MKDHPPDQVTDANQGPLLSVREVAVEYRVRNAAGKAASLRAVDGVTFDVGQGRTVGLVGESGCGKSTLGRAIVQVEDLTRGDIALDGKSVTGLSSRDLLSFRRRVQMIFQNPQASLNPRRTIGQSLYEPLQVHSAMRIQDHREWIEGLLDRVGLSKNVMSRYPHHLSGGQQQRVAIARALAVDPDLIVCDEPVSALDVSIQAQITSLMVELQRESGLAYLFIAHDLAVVRAIANSVVVMYLGKVVEIGDSESIFRRPRHPYTIALLSASPVPNARMERERERIILQGDLPDPMNPPTGCRFRTRCPWAMPICAEEEPVLLAVEHGHKTACHFTDEVSVETRRYLPWVEV